MDINGSTLTLHQSDIKHFITCPDQFRRVNGILPGGNWDPGVDIRVETDAATLGTVFHKVLETDIVKPFPSETDAVRFAKNVLGETIMEYTLSGVEYRTESFGGDPIKQLDTLAMLTERWYRSDERAHWVELYDHQPEHIQLEWKFKVPLLERPGKTFDTVLLAGTADVLDTYTNRLVDWKTSSRKYERWEKQRWDQQATIYTYAAAQEGLLQRGEEGYRFDFKVFNHRYNDPEPQTVEVWRDQGSWGWMIQQVSNMVTLIESDLEVWPLRDDHALCGPKWCPVWADCKGTFVSHPKWR